MPGRGRCGCFAGKRGKKGREGASRVACGGFKKRKRREHEGGVVISITSGIPEAAFGSRVRVRCRFIRKSGRWRSQKQRKCKQRQQKRLSLSYC